MCAIADITQIIKCDTETVTIQQVPDGDGAPITLGRLYGVWTAPWTSLPEQISRAQRFTFDDRDVILVGYAKSGTHWLWEILHMLLRNKAEHCQTPKERLMLSFSTQEYFDMMATPRVFNTHAPFIALPIAIKSGRNKCKMVYILRNPKDLAVSYYHHLKAAKEFEYDGSFRGFLQLFIEGKVPGGSWFDFVLEWEQTLRNNPHLPILTVHYEDLKEVGVGGAWD
ncbi:hypothetical protein C0Q70_07009 [Pomacea canaliculata]|uniref:Sulfotransferase domain-containing protein n=1 Tax=Pomacea canaliculata TaxID=400727 RepID=A0A2T7PDV0_POMCA|nr:hypothetical protein C0Q70_07009 [Pomacea canaliculata]